MRLRYDLPLAAMVGVIISDFIENPSHYFSFIFGILGIILLIKWDWFFKEFKGE